MKQLLAITLASAASLLATATAHAVEVTELVTEIGAQKASVSTIGMTILGVIVAIVCFNWIRRAIK